MRYTYRIEDLTDPDGVQRGFHEHARRGIRKASAAVEVDHDYPLERLLCLELVFDFEGSMVKPVEHFFRGFGGRQTQYFCSNNTAPKAQPALAAQRSRAAVDKMAHRRG